MRPALKQTDPLFTREVMAVAEERLMLECAFQIKENLEAQIKTSRNLKQISELEIHQQVVNRMIENIKSNQYGV